MKCLLGLVLCAVCALAPQGPRALKVRARGRNLLVTERGRRHLLRVGELVDAARIEEVSVVFESRAGGFVYLLLDVCGPSKGESDARQCGAGTECDLLWLKLDDAYRLAGSDAARYESCWGSATSDEGYKVTGRTLWIDFVSFRERLEYKLSYDADRPEHGWQIEKTPLPSP